MAVQYSQNAVFSFEKGSICQNHSSGSHHLLKNCPSKIFDSPPLTGGGIYPLTLYCYLENPAQTEGT